DRLPDQVVHVRGEGVLGSDDREPDHRQDEQGQGAAPAKEEGAQREPRRPVTHHGRVDSWRTMITASAPRRARPTTTTSAGPRPCRRAARAIVTREAGCGGAHGPA